MKYTRYKKYKPSWIDWIWEIPEGWNEQRLKSNFHFKKWKNSQLYSWEYVNDPLRSWEYPVYSWQTDNNWVMWRISTYLYDYGNRYVMLVTTVWAKAMTIFKINGRFTLSQNCALIDLKNDLLDINYYFYYCQRLFDYERELIPDIMQPSLRIEDLREYNIIIPPLQTQQNISSFLDKKTSQIDKLIEKDKKLIELLKEKRASLINTTVTKWLDKKAEMRDSGVDWIWEIPKDWNIIKFSRVSDIRDWTHDTPVYVDESSWIPFVTSKDIKEGKIDFTWVKYISSKDHNKIRQRSHVEKWDILMPMIWTVWNPCIVDTNIEFSIKNVALFKKRNMSLSFLFYYLISSACRTFIDLKLSWWIQSFIWLEDIRALSVIVPGSKEQKQIVDFLDKETQKIDLHIQKVEKRISLYKEHKKSLIHNTVTGKIEII